MLAVAQLRLPIDNTRMSVSGTSNGGMMAHRIACNVGRSDRPGLALLSAIGVNIATMPQPLLAGTNGREPCLLGSSVAVPMIYVVGTGIDTPQCTSFPCTSPVVSGDGRMPFGESGTTYVVNSPELGEVLSAPDAHSFMINHNAAVLSAPPTTLSTTIGLRATHTRYSFGASNATVELLISEGGLHSTGGTAFDVQAFARIIEFVLRFSRTNGVVVVDGSSSLTGDY
jgi:poly(3-hydroxybutyrate) depolymerase